MALSNVIKLEDYANKIFNDVMHFESMSDENFEQRYQHFRNITQVQDADGTILAEYKPLSDDFLKEFTTFTHHYRELRQAGQVFNKEDIKNYIVQNLAWWRSTAQQNNASDRNGEQEDVMRDDIHSFYSNNNASNASSHIYGEILEGGASGGKPKSKSKRKKHQSRKKKAAKKSNKKKTHHKKSKSKKNKKVKK